MAQGPAVRSAATDARRRRPGSSLHPAARRRRRRGQRRRRCMMRPTPIVSGNDTIIALSCGTARLQDRQRRGWRAAGSPSPARRRSAAQRNSAPTSDDGRRPPPARSMRRARAAASGRLVASALQQHQVAADARRRRGARACSGSGRRPTTSRSGIGASGGAEREPHLQRDDLAGQRDALHDAPPRSARSTMPITSSIASGSGSASTSSGSVDRAGTSGSSSDREQHGDRRARTRAAWLVIDQSGAVEHQPARAAR